MFTVGGNGAQSIEVLALAPRSVFTAPDRTQNFYSGITAQGTYRFSDALSLSGTLFARQVDTRSYNGDASDFDTCDDNDAILCDDDGAPVLDQNGNALPAQYNAINNIGVCIPDPAPGTAEAMAWHIEAVRHNWIGEFFPARQPVRREAIRVSA